MPKKQHKEAKKPSNATRCWSCWSYQHETRSCTRPPLSLQQREDLRLELGLQRPNDSNYTDILDGKTPCFNCFCRTDHLYGSCPRRALDNEARDKLRRKMGCPMYNPWRRMLEKEGFVIEGDIARKRWEEEEKMAEEAEEPNEEKPPEEVEPKEPAQVAALPQKHAHPLSLMDEDIPELQVPIMSLSPCIGPQHIKRDPSPSDDLCFKSTLRLSDVSTRASLDLAERFESLKSEVVLLRRQSREYSNKVIDSLDDVNSSLRILVSLLAPAASTGIKVQVSGGGGQAWVPVARRTAVPPGLPPPGFSAKKPSVDLGRQVNGRVGRDTE